MIKLQRTEYFSKETIKYLVHQHAKKIYAHSFKESAIQTCFAGAENIS